ncbi:hypothetical protein BD309DRAFT_815411, partial [Dichomitus squalens]
KLSIHRKFVFALKGDVYLHYNPFATPDDLRKQVCAYNYTPFGIGPVYSTCKIDRPSTLTPQFRNLIFDIDMF